VETLVAGGALAGDRIRDACDTYLTFQR